MLLPAIFGCSKRHVAIINVVSSCSNKENKGNFGFLKIDATNAVFVGFGGPPENADSSYLSQTDSLSYGAFVQVLGTFDQKNGAYNPFSSFIEASWLMCQGSIPFANFLAPAFC